MQEEEGAGFSTHAIRAEADSSRLRSLNYARLFFRAEVPASTPLWLPVALFACKICEVKSQGDGYVLP